HGHFQHRIVLVEDAFDLGAGDVLAARHDHVLEPIDDEEVAVVVSDADVARVEPAAGERGGGRVRIAPVALEDLWPAHDDLAALSRRYRPPLLVPDVELEVEARTADAAELGHDAVAVEKGVTGDRLGE